jgi:hypothetical protein
VPDGVDADGLPLAVIRSVLARPVARFSLRSEGAGALAVHRGWVSPDGLVIVAGEPGPHVSYEPRLAGALDAVARTIARLMDLGPVRPDPAPPPAGPLAWADVVAPVDAGRAVGWAGTWEGDGSEPLPPLRLHHLRVTTEPVEPAVTVLVVVDAGVTGIVAVEPDASGLHRLRRRTAAEVWHDLTAVSASIGHRLDRAGAARRET